MWHRRSGTDPCAARHSLQTGCASATLAGSDVGIVTREIGTDGGRSVVVVLALEKVQRRRYLAHHDHDRLRRCLDGPRLGQVADDALDVGEELALPLAQTLHVPARLRVGELDDDDLRLATRLFMLASLLAGARCRICNRQSPSSSSSSSSTLIFGILKGAALRISFMAFFCAFIRFDGSSKIHDLPPFATESRCR